MYSKTCFNMVPNIVSNVSKLFFFIIYNITMARTRRRRTRRGNRRGNNKRSRKSFKQKLYNMKGCSKSRQKSRRKGRSRRFRGGNCATCSSPAALSGGAGTSPLIGAPWDSNQMSLSNYYANNLYDTNDVQTQMQLNGGSNKRRNKRRLRGGGLSDFLPSDITNLGNDIMYNSSSAYNSLTGADAPVNPSPHQGHLTASLNANRIII
jgi:hypothetical protein